MADPYQSISVLAFERTFDALMQRGTPLQKISLQRAKEDFQRSGGTGKAEAMQHLLAAFPEDTVPTMTAMVRGGHAPPPRAAYAPSTAAALAQSVPVDQFQQTYVRQMQANQMQLQAQQHQAMQQHLLLQSGLKRTREDGTEAGQPARDVKPSTSPAAQRPQAAADAAAAKQGKVDAPNARDENDMTDDKDKLQDLDALASIGVNVAAEQEMLMSGTRHMRTLREAMPKHQEEYVLNQQPLLELMGKIAMRNGLSGVDPACAVYLSLAVEAHMGRLLKSMARIHTQRTDPARRYEAAEIVGPSRSRQGAAPASDQDPSSNQDGIQGPGQAANQAPQSHFTFRKQRPLLVRGDGTSELFVGLVRQLDPTTTLSAAPAAASKPGGGSVSAAAAEPASLELEDLVGAMERDTMFCKHPMLWRLQQKLT